MRSSSFYLIFTPPASKGLQTRRSPCYCLTMKKSRQLFLLSGIVLIAALSTTALWWQARNNDAESLSSYTNLISAPRSAPLSTPTSAPVSGPTTASLLPCPSPLAPCSSPNEPTTYLLLGDSGAGDRYQQAVADAMADYCLGNNCTAAFIAGDVIYDFGVQSVQDAQFQTKFETPYSGLDIPLLHRLRQPRLPRLPKLLYRVFGPFRQIVVIGDSPSILCAAPQVSS